jgi:hypothetical protein
VLLSGQLAAQNRKKPAPRPDPEETSSESGSDSDDASTDSLDIGKMKKDGLIKLCGTHGLATTGTAADLRSRLHEALHTEKERSHDEGPKRPRQDDEDDDPDGWASTISGRIRNLEIHKRNPTTFLTNTSNSGCRRSIIVGFRLD